ncbi:MAG: DNA-protecting protein DprA [Clostridia bacterium]|nr:DNA-protecting protein DprA [Clostridia bacterium]
MANIITNQDLKVYVQKHLEYMERNNIDIIFIEDKEYPSLLKEIYSPPLCLYVKGDKNILNNVSISIIGCREATQYGISVAKEFAYNLSNQNINIISGLAKGIDSAAHLGAIKANKRTIAVLGNGLDTIYPKENYKLSQDILNSGGAIISEYPLGTSPKKQHFPARNRLISGMSNGVLVVEAKEKSGTMITVDFALEQGRDVFVIPGKIDSDNSTGTNKLIKQGARLVTNWEECIEDYKNM